MLIGSIRILLLTASSTLWLGCNDSIDRPSSDIETLKPLNLKESNAARIVQSYPVEGIPAAKKISSLALEKISEELESIQATDATSAFRAQIKVAESLIKAESRLGEAVKDDASFTRAEEDRAAARELAKGKVRDLQVLVIGQDRHGLESAWLREEGIMKKLYSLENTEAKHYDFYSLTETESLLSALSLSASLSGGSMLGSDTEAALRKLGEVFRAVSWKPIFLCLRGFEVVTRGFIDSGLSPGNKMSVLTRSLVAAKQRSDDTAPDFLGPDSGRLELWLLVRSLLIRDFWAIVDALTTNIPVASGSETDIDDTLVKWLNEMFEEVQLSTIRQQPAEELVAKLESISQDASAEIDSMMQRNSARQVSGERAKQELGAQLVRLRKNIRDLAESESRSSDSQLYFVRISEILRELSALGLSVGDDASFARAEKEAVRLRIELMNLEKGGSSPQDFLKNTIEPIMDRLEKLDFSGNGFSDPKLVSSFETLHYGLSVLKWVGAEISSVTARWLGVFRRGLITIDALRSLFEAFEGVSSLIGASPIAKKKKKISVLVSSLVKARDRVTQLTSIPGGKGASQVSFNMINILLVESFWSQIDLVNSEPSGPYDDSSDTYTRIEEIEVDSLKRIFSKLQFLFETRQNGEDIMSNLEEIIRLSEEQIDKIVVTDPALEKSARALKHELRTELVFLQRQLFDDQGSNDMN